MKEEIESPATEIIEITVGTEEAGKRIDSLLASLVEGLSRSHAQKAIEEQKVTVNGQAVKQNYRVKAEDSILLERSEPVDPEARPENIPLEILYEDSDLIVINKPQGMVVHPAPGNTSGTLVNALLYHCRDLSGINGKLRPGIVHRIDKDTSGILVVAKNDVAHRGLAKQLKDHTMSREYVALVHGNLKHSSGTIDAPIGRSLTDRKKMAVSFKNSRNAITHFDVLESFQGYTLVKLKLETGRTHQIRVHLAYIKHPVVGDPKYGPPGNDFGLKQQALHAYRLGFDHPRSGEYLEFSVGLPAYFLDLLCSLGSVKGVEWSERLEKAVHGEQPDPGTDSEELS